MIDGRRIKWSNLLLIIGIPLAGLLLIVSSAKVLSWTWAHAWIVPLGAILGLGGYFVYTGKLRLPEEIALPSAPRVKGKDGTGAGGTLFGWVKWLWSFLTWPLRKLKWLILIAIIIASFISGVIVTVSADSVLSGFLSKIPVVGELVGLAGNELTPGQTIPVDDWYGVYVGPAPKGIDLKNAELTVVNIGGILGIGSKSIVVIRLPGQTEITAGKPDVELDDKVYVVETPDSGVIPPELRQKWDGLYEQLRGIDWPW